MCFINAAISAFSIHYAGITFEKSEHWSHWVQRSIESILWETICTACVCVIRSMSIKWHIFPMDFTAKTVACWSKIPSSVTHFLKSTDIHFRQKRLEMISIWYANPRWLLCFKLCDVLVILHWTTINWSVWMWCIACICKQYITI